MNSKVYRREVLPTIVLPSPHKEGSKDISRPSAHGTGCPISPASLPPQLLSDLLWSAYGEDRVQDIDLYLATPEAIYFYDPHDHQLVPVIYGDWRRETVPPGQEEALSAPIQFIYVADLYRATCDHSRSTQVAPRQSSYFTHTGVVAGNVYMFATGHGLAALFHECNRRALVRALSLGAEQRLLFAQSIGYPARP